jgi:hypothetical protein
MKIWFHTVQCILNKQSKEFIEIALFTMISKIFKMFKIPAFLYVYQESHE